MNKNKMALRYQAGRQSYLPRFHVLASSLLLLNTSTVLCHLSVQPRSAFSLSIRSTMLSTNQPASNTGVAVMVIKPSDGAYGTRKVVPLCCRIQLLLSSLQIGQAPLVTDHYVGSPDLGLDGGPLLRSGRHVQGTLIGLNRLGDFAPEFNVANGLLYGLKLLPEIQGLGDFASPFLSPFVGCSMFPTRQNEKATRLQGTRV